MATRTVADRRPIGSDDLLGLANHIGLRLRLAAQNADRQGAPWRARTMRRLAAEVRRGAR